MIKILFLASNPIKSSHLQLDEEIRAINQKIRDADHRDTLRLIPVLAVRPDDLLQALNEHKPQIVHFSGHGNNTGEIILTDNNRQPKLVSTAALKALFKTLKDNIRLVVLNACYSEIQAKAIVEFIDCAIGMNSSIGDQAAITFASSFYRAIGFGRSVQEAFEQGRTSLLLEGIQEDKIPDLLVREGIDVSQIILTEPVINQEEEIAVRSMPSESRFFHLQQLLERKLYRDADVETLHVMLEVLERKRDDWLRDNELVYFPCEELIQIDKLWREYSNDRFGFSLQWKIYQSCKASTDESIWEEFMRQVGWLKKNWVVFEDYKPPYDRGHYSYDFAPQGYLPWMVVHNAAPTDRGLFVPGYSQGPHSRFVNLGQRLENCVVECSSV